MADENYFSPDSIVALRNYSLAMHSLKAIFESEETARFTTLVERFGRIDSELTRLRKIEAENIYWQSGLWNNSLKLWFGMGVVFTPPNSDGYPQLLLCHSLKHRSPIFPEYQVLMRKAAADVGWDFYQWDEKVGIAKQQSLATILGEENRIEAAQRFFREAVDDLEQIMKTHLAGFLEEQM